MGGPLNTIKETVEVLSKGADQLSTSIEEERLLLNEFHKQDMLSDSWLSKNIRPIMWIATFLSLIFFGILSIWFDIPEIIFYQIGAAFGGISAIYIPLRSYEKRQRMKLNEAKSKMIFEKGVARLERKAVRQLRRNSK